VVAAAQATTLDPSCPTAWAVLAFARYRASYDICGRGDLSAAAEAARKAVELAADPGQRRVAWMHVGRIAEAQLKWDEAIKAFQEALKAGHRDARNWLSDLAVRENPSTQLLAAAKKILAGEAISEEDLKSLTYQEAGFLYNAPLARHGRRLNVGALDWFFFCDGSPLTDRPRMDPSSPSAVVKKGTTDWDSSLLLRKHQQSVTRK
jgi:tetratricopeptide (TPR) repeat protein